MTRGLRSSTYGLARFLGDLNAIRSGRIVRRAKNRMVGRILGRAGFWRWLWK